MSRPVYDCPNCGAKLCIIASHPAIQSYMNRPSVHLWNAETADGHADGRRAKDDRTCAGCHSLLAVIETPANYEAWNDAMRSAIRDLGRADAFDYEFILA